MYSLRVIKKIKKGATSCLLSVENVEQDAQITGGHRSYERPRRTTSRFLSPPPEIYQYYFKFADSVSLV
jgi:hypothetical protein